LKNHHSSIDERRNREIKGIDEKCSYNRKNDGLVPRQQAEPQRGINNMQFSRVTKIEFPRIGGDDFSGWLFMCEQFIKVDNIVDGQKANLISIHLHDIALMWHRQFVRIMGDNVEWAVYRQAILKRFGLDYDDPLT
ncbi:hypothetical protein Tco_1024434, partial [Tanacetum coccineum]